MLFIMHNPKKENIHHQSLAHLNFVIFYYIERCYIILKALYKIF